MPTKPYISLSNSLNKKNTFNLRTFEIPNYITNRDKHLENNCSGVIKNDISKNDNSWNTLHINSLNINSMRKNFGTLCTIFKQQIKILLVSETKIDDTFPVEQFCVESYSTTYRLDRTNKGEGVFLYVREDIPSKQMKLKSIEN